MVVEPHFVTSHLIRHSGPSLQLRGVIHHLLLQLRSAVSYGSVFGISMAGPKRKREEEDSEESGEKVTSSDMLVGSAPTSLRACVKLSNGVLMPWIGFGTYGLKDAAAKSAPTSALEVGYRLLDTVTFRPL